MAELPRNVSDLYLAPVALAIDETLAALSVLSADEITRRIAIETNREPHDTASRQGAVLEAVTRLETMHGWTAAWDDRGLRLTHGDHTLVLGLAPTLRAYLGL